MTIRQDLINGFGTGKAFKDLYTNNFTVKKYHTLQEQYKSQGLILHWHYKYKMWTIYRFVNVDKGVCSEQRHNVHSIIELINVDSVIEKFNLIFNKDS